MTDRNWRKSSRSGSGPQCVEIAPGAGAWFVRDSKNPTGEEITTSPAAFAAFVRAAKRDGFSAAG